MPKLRWLALNANGNTLAYSLTAFSRMLEVDKGWDFVDPQLVTRVSARTSLSRDSGWLCATDLLTDDTLVTSCRWSSWW